MSHKHNQKPSTVATDERDSYLPKSGSNGHQSKIQSVKVGDEAQAQPHTVLHVKDENPQLASKNQVVYRRFLNPQTERLCPRGTWKAICWLFFLASTVALILFIIDMVKRRKL